MTENCLSWADLTETVSPNGIGKRTLVAEHATLVRITVPAGTSASRHSHPHEQVVQVISGSGRLETAQGHRDFGPGSLFHFRAEVWHVAVFDTETVLVEVNFKP